MPEKTIKFHFFTYKSTLTDENLIFEFKIMLILIDLNMMKPSQFEISLPVKSYNKKNG